MRTQTSSPLACPTRVHTGAFAHLENCTVQVLGVGALRPLPLLGARPIFVIIIQPVLRALSKLRPTALACSRFMNGRIRLRFRCNGGNTSLVQLHTMLIVLLFVLCQLGTANRARTSERHQLGQCLVHPSSCVLVVDASVGGAAECDTSEMTRGGLSHPLVQGSNANHLDASWTTSLNKNEPHDVLGFKYGHPFGVWDWKSW